MNRNSVDFGAGVMTGGFIMMIVSIVVFGYMVIRPLNTELAKHKELVVECEQHLPRNVHCELKAVVAFPKIEEK